MQSFEPVVPAGYIFSLRTARDFILTKAHNGTVALKKGSDLAPQLFVLPRANFLEDLVIKFDKEWAQKKKQGE
jgi:hypothetical protein